MDNASSGPIDYSMPYQAFFQMSLSAHHSCTSEDPLKSDSKDEILQKLDVAMQSVELQGYRPP